MQIQSLDELGTEKEIKLFGKTTATKLQRLKVLIVGVQYLGMEIAKHIAIQTPEIITLCDQNCKATEKLIKSINQVSQIQIMEYNEQEILKEAAKHDLTIICDQLSFKLAKQVSTLLREINQKTQNKRFNQGVIWTCTFGYACLTFCDYGDQFKIYDRDGVQPFPYHIKNISQNTPGIVTIDESIAHNFIDGDFVCIHEVEGMTQVNGNEPRPIKILSQTEFTIEDTKQFKKYIGGGLVQMAKVPFKFRFRTLENQILKPNISDTNEDLTVYYTIISIINHLDSQEQFNNDQIIEQAREYYNELNEQLSIKTLKQFKTLRFPVINFWSGINSLEIVKFTGKFTPNETQFCQFISDININDDVLKDKLSKQNILIVGCGGTGCELVRQLATMECCNIPDYKLTILDDDLVRKYGLLSHFWFKQNQLGQLKSKIAQEQAWLINQNMNVELINKKFNASQEQCIQQNDIIFSGINTHSSRQQIKELGQKNQKIIFDQILNGLKAYSQIILPKQNIDLEDSLKTVLNVEKDIYKKYPYLPIHCVLWAKDVFENSFIGFVNDFKKYITEPATYVKECTDDKIHNKTDVNYGNLLLKAHVIYRMTKKGFNLTLDKILSLSKELFEYHFKYKIQELLNSKTIEWSGYKRKPQIVNFNQNDTDHVIFIQITTILISKIFNINSSAVFKPEFVTDKLRQMTDNYWNLNDNEMPKTEDFIIQFEPQHLNFDEDQIRGIYVRCIHSLANLRAKNYDIKSIPLHKVQKYAVEVQRSNPIMHSIIVGFMGIEHLKYLYDSNCQHRRMYVDINKNILEFK